MDSRVDFEKRVGTLARQHKAMSNGYRTRVRSDGLIVIKPRRTRRGLPWRGLLLIVAGFFIFKAFMFASLNEITYNQRVAVLGGGTVVEQAGAWAMQADPATVFLAGFLEPLT